MYIIIVGLGGIGKNLTRLGVDDRYLFDLGGREQLHRLCGIDEEGVVKPFYYDLVSAAREFQTLLATCILGINNGLYKIGKAA